LLGRSITELANMNTEKMYHAITQFSNSQIFTIGGVSKNGILKTF